MGLLGWSPEQFWDSTMHDLVAAQEGWGVAQGDTSWRDEALAMELRAKLDEFKKQRRP